MAAGSGGGECSKQALALAPRGRRMAACLSGATGGEVTVLAGSNEDITFKRRVRGKLWHGRSGSATRVVQTGWRFGGPGRRRCSGLRHGEPSAGWPHLGGAAAPAAYMLTTDLQAAVVGAKMG